MRSDKKVIILDNIKSDCIEQAMFILKEPRPENIDAVSEAEKIVENYTRRCRYAFYPKRARRRHVSGAALFGIIVGAAIFFSVLAMTGVI